MAVWKAEERRCIDLDCEIRSTVARSHLWVAVIVVAVVVDAAAAGAGAADAIHSVGWQGLERLLITVGWGGEGGRSGCRH